MFLLLRNLRYEFNRPYSRLRGNDRGESARAITKQNAHRPPGGGCRAEHDGGWGTITTMTTPSRKACHPSAEGNFIPRRYVAGTQSQRGALPCGWFCGGKLHYEIFAQVYFFNHFVLDDFGGGAVFQNFPIVQNITAVGNAQRFANVVVGDNHAQTAIF